MSATILLQYVITFALGIGTVVLAQRFVDYYRGQNRTLQHAVPKKDFEELEKRFNKLVIRLERQGIETNGE